MTKRHPVLHTCSICEKSFSNHDVVPGELIRKEIVLEIKRACPDWNTTHFICHADLEMMRSRYVHSLLLLEKKELSSLDHAVLQSLDEQALLSLDGEDAFDDAAQKWTLGERLADKIATFGGSWWFLICFSLFLVLWVVGNSLIIWLRPADPYPFIFLNLILSCLAAVQAPVIMMSQNRQEAKDRVRAQHDYKINLKAELEIRHLNEKMDHLLAHQWEKMVKIQEIQLEMLTELNHKKQMSVAE